MVGTTNVWLTRHSSTVRSHSPASKRGRITMVRPEWSVIRRPSVPPM